MNAEQTQVKAPGVAWWIPAYLTNLIRKSHVRIVPVTFSPMEHPGPNEETYRLFRRLRENSHARFVVKR